MPIEQERAKAYEAGRLVERAEIAAALLALAGTYLDDPTGRAQVRALYEAYALILARGVRAV